MDRRYSGRCSMYRSWFAIGLVGIAGWVNAAEAPLPELQSPESFSPEQVEAVELQKAAQEGLGWEQRIQLFIAFP